MKIYGSCALKHWYPETRIPSDIDIISPNHDWIPAFQYLLENNKHSQYVDPNFLFTIKVSHASWNIHWDKTLHDIVFLKNKGCTLDKEFYNLLYNDWKKIHKKKNVKLSTSNDKFFTNKITRKYSHDYLHEILSFYEQPLHEKIRKDLNSPQCDEKLFNELSNEDQFKCALEEVLVIATERFVLSGRPLNNSKYLALKTLITSSTTGWFNLYLILNFDKLIYSNNTHWKTKLLEIDK